MFFIYESIEVRFQEGGWERDFFFRKEYIKCAIAGVHRKEEFVYLSKVVKE